MPPAAIFALRFKDQAETYKMPSFFLWKMQK